MGDLGPIIVAIITSIGTLGAAAFGARRFANRRGGDGARTAAKWREQAELAAARAELVAEEREDERAARRADAATAAAALQAEVERRLAAERKLETTQHDLDDCARQRDNAFSELRQVGHRRTPRTPRVGS